MPTFQETTFQEPTRQDQRVADSQVYIQLFHRYIAHSLDKLNTRLEDDAEHVAIEVREQAWHLIDYALKLPMVWDAVRMLLLALAPQLERAGFRHEWLPYLERGVAVSQQLQDVAGEAQLSLYIGRLYRLRGMLSPAREWFEVSARLCSQAGDKVGRATALNQLAYVARLQSQYAQTQAYVDEALSLLDANDSERANSHWVLGTMAQAQLNWAEAERHHRMALNIWQTVGHDQRVAWSLQNLGDTLRGARRYAEAAEYLQQAIVLLGKLDDSANQAIARMNRGIVHIYDNDPAQALALFLLAEAVFRQVGDQLHLAMVCNNITIVQRELGNWREAEKACNQAIDLWEMLGNQKLLAGSLEELGLTLLAQRRFDESVEIFERALAILFDIPTDPFQASLSTELRSHIAKARNKGASDVPDTPT